MAATKVAMYIAATRVLNNKTAPKAVNSPIRQSFGEFIATVRAALFI